MSFFRKAVSALLAAVISVTAMSTSVFADNTKAVTADTAEIAQESDPAPHHNYRVVYAPILYVTTSSSGFKFTWDDTWDIIYRAVGYSFYRSEGYEIFYSYDNGNDYQKLYTVLDTRTEITITTLNPNTTYKFKMRAFAYERSTGLLWTSDFSDVVTVTAREEIITKPGTTTLSASVSSSGYSFSWKGVKDAAGYQIYYASYNSTSFKQLISVGADVTSVKVNTLDTKKSYKFKIRAYAGSSGKEVYGDYSREVSTSGISSSSSSSSGSSSSSSSSTSRPAKTTLKATISGSDIHLSWKAVSGVSKYQIYCSYDGGKSYSRLATISSKRTSADLKGFDLSKSYKFRIRSYKVVNGKKIYSKYSAAATTKAVA